MKILAFKCKPLAMMALVAALVLVNPAHATTWYVSICGQDGWVGVNPNCVAPLGPKRTIQAAINVSSDGDTVMVMPGTYFEKIDLDGKAITLIASGGPGVTTIDGNDSGPVVKCNSGETEDTVIQGFSITSGSTTLDGGAWLNVLSSPTIIGCSIHTNYTTGNGGAMANFAASPTIIDCVITFNQAGAEPPAAGKGQGGAIYCVGGNMTISDSFFQTSYATRHGGIIALINNATATLTNCDFYTSGTTFSHGKGGGIFLDHANLTIENCLFDGVNAWSPNSEGGSILAINDSQVTCTGTTFYSASAETHGGAASLHDSNATFIGCEFSELIASEGGAVYVNGGSFSATLCGFLDAEAYTGNGGALFAENATVNLGLCTFTHNVADLSGGAVFVTGGQLTMQGCNFSDNQTENNGGAVCVSSAELSASACTFANNTCLSMGQWQSSGGGMFFWSVSTAATIEECEFNGNAASHGGGLYAGATLFGGSNPVLLTSCTFDGNNAYLGGGAAYLPTSQGVTSRVMNCQFTNNTSSGSAGGVDATGLGRLLIHGCVFEDNSAQQGGGLQCSGNNESYGEVDVSACRFSGNTANSSGSAVDVSSLGHLKMFNCVAHNNTSAAGGGAVAESADGFWQGSFDLANCTIANNNGGGIFVTSESTSSTISNSIVWGNSNGGQFTATLPAVRYSTVQGGAPGPGNKSLTPLFVGALIGNYRLMPTSPCIDAGHNWGVPEDLLDLNGNGNIVELLPFDFDGNPRITDNIAIANCEEFAAVVDMGAFESAGAPPPVPVIIADVNGDGLVSVIDLLAVISAWGPCQPCCAEDFNLDGVVNVQDLLTLINHWAP